MEQGFLHFSFFDLMDCLIPYSLILINCCPLIVILIPCSTFSSLIELYYNNHLPIDHTSILTPYIEPSAIGLTSVISEVGSESGCQFRVAPGTEGWVRAWWGYDSGRVQVWEGFSFGRGLRFSQVALTCTACGG